MSKLHLGTIGWSYDFWKLNFYPQKTTSKDFLYFYASRFNTVEVDSTFYRIPSPQTVKNWAHQTPKGFLFSMKFPQAITHIKQLKDAQAETDRFLECAHLLEDKLGVLLLQFPPNFGFGHIADLEAYLTKLPNTFRYVVEVRSAGWLKEEFYALLRQFKVGLAWADSPMMLPLREVTADYLYVRWEGDRRKVNGTLGKIEADRAAELQVWADRLKPFLQRGFEMFGYFGKYFSGYPPSDVVSLKSLLE